MPRAPRRALALRQRHGASDAGPVPVRVGPLAVLDSVVGVISIVSVAVGVGGVGGWA